MKRIISLLIAVIIMSCGINVNIAKAGSISISIDSPSNGATYTVGDNVSLRASLSVNVTSDEDSPDYNYVRFFVKDSPSQSSYLWNSEAQKSGTVIDTWNTSGYSAGTYYIYAAVFDYNNYPIADDYATVILKDTAIEPPSVGAIINEPPSASPRISVISPSRESSYSIGDSVSLMASVSGNGYSYLRFFVKDSPNQSGYLWQGDQLSGTSVSDTWNTNGYSAGTYYIFGAVFDGNHYSLDDDYISVTLKEKEIEQQIKTPTTISITSGNNGKSYNQGDTINLTATVGGTDYSYARFLVKKSPAQSDYIVSGTTKTGANISDTVNTGNYAAETYYISAVAYDKNNMELAEDMITVNINMVQTETTANISKDEINNIKTNDIVKQRFKDVTALDIQKFLEKRNSRLKDINFGQKFNMDTKNYFGYQTVSRQHFSTKKDAQRLQ